MTNTIQVRSSYVPLERKHQDEFFWMEWIKEMLRESRLN